MVQDSRFKVQGVDVPDNFWQNWHWQLRNACRSSKQLSSLFPDDEVAAEGNLPVFITPYYLRLLQQHPDAESLRKTVFPSVVESQDEQKEYLDPLGEKQHQVTNCVIHTYPDKVLFLATDCCAVHCQYCTRSRWIGRGTCARSDWQEGFDYIRQHPLIRDVLISGGDPLILDDDSLNELLSSLRRIRHVEIIRIGTKIPAVLPQRITKELLAVLKKYHPLWMVLHFTHPVELTAECVRACERLADAGVPLTSQTVLLRGVNDCTETIKKLMQGLLKARVRPYYLFQCDPVKGSAFFRTPVKTGQKIIRQLHGHTSGLAVPTFMIDAPGGGGKVPVGPSYVDGYDGEHWQLRDYLGRETNYYDPDD